MQDYYDFVQYLSKDGNCLIIAQYRKEQVKDVLAIDLESGVVSFGSGAVRLADTIERFQAEQVVYMDRKFVSIEDLLTEEGSESSESGVQEGGNEQWDFL